MPRQLKVTREGKVYVFVTIGLGLGAINTGNNLLYLLLGMLLSLIIVSGVLSEISLQKLEFQRFIPERLHAGSPCLVAFSVVNHKRYFSSFSIDIADQVEGVEYERGCFFLKLPPGSKQELTYRLTFPRRGRYQFTAIRVSTKFPFSIFEKSRLISLEEEVIALPALYQVVPPQLAPSHQKPGEQSTSRRGEGVDFFMLRDWQAGDEIRWIHWPSTAKSGELTVREFENQQEGETSLLLWNLAPAGEDKPDISTLDDSVSYAASLMVSLSALGQRVRFATAEQRFPELRSPRDFQELLTTLALLDYTDSPRFLPSSGELLCLLPSNLQPPTLEAQARILTVPAAGLEGQIEALPEDVAGLDLQANSG
jgi:uncharacterized protein (DUF58 family)